MESNAPRTSIRAAVRNERSQNEWYRQILRMRIGILLYRGLDENHINYNIIEILMVEGNYIPGTNSVKFHRSSDDDLWNRNHTKVFL